VLIPLTASPALAQQTGNGGGPAGLLSTEAIAALVGAIVGIVGLLFVEFVVRPHQEQRKLTLRLIENYLGKQQEQAIAEGHLNEGQTRLLCRQYRHDVRVLGNWFNIVALLHESGQLDVELAERSGLVVNAAVYYRKVENWSRIMTDDEARKRLEGMVSAWSQLKTMKMRLECLGRLPK